MYVAPAVHARVFDWWNLLADFAMWLVVGGFTSFFTWRAEGFLGRKNERWREKRQERKVNETN